MSAVPDKQPQTHIHISTKFTHTRITNYLNVFVLGLGEDAQVPKPHKQHINSTEKPSKVSRFTRLHSHAAF